MEAVFRARRLALAGDDEAAAALLRRLEVVPEGKSAELIEAFRARRKLVEKAAAEMGTPIDDPGLAQRLGDAGRRTVLAHFGMAAMAGQYRSVYDRVLRRQPAVAA